MGNSILILFMLNLVFSFPLVLYPAHKIVEQYLYTGWKKSKKRQWSKNLNRTLLVLAITILTIALGNKVDKFLSLLGALTCTPIAFCFPSLFHYKACATTTKQKVIDLSVFFGSLIALIFCSYQSVVNWND